MRIKLIFAVITVLAAFALWRLGGMERVALGVTRISSSANDAPPAGVADSPLTVNSSASASKIPIPIGHAASSASRAVSSVGLLLRNAQEASDLKEVAVAAVADVVPAFALGEFIQ